MQNKISKLLDKYQLRIACGGKDTYSEFSFVRDEGFWNDGFIDESTGLYMSEEMAAPILAVIEDIIPYSYDYYYENLPVRKVEAEKIYNRMQEVRLTVFQNPLDPSLGKIAERLRYSEFSSGRRFRESVDSILFCRRYELAALYKFFMMWLRPYDGGYCDFWVSGP